VFDALSLDLTSQRRFGFGCLISSRASFLEKSIYKTAAFHWNKKYSPKFPMNTALHSHAGWPTKMIHLDEQAEVLPGSGQRAAGSGQRAAGSGQRAAGSGQ